MADRDGSPMASDYGGMIRVDPVERKKQAPAKAVSQDNRVHNRALVLRTLYQAGPLSRSDLARASKLTRPTVSALVAELMEEQLITDVGTRTEHRVGKPATLLQIDDDAMNILAIDLSSADHMIGAVLNLRGDILDKVDLEVDGALGHLAYERVLELGRTLLERASKPVLGMGVGTPGIIDDEGTVRFGQHVHWVDLPLAKQLTHEFGIPVVVGNDIGMAALGVLHFRDVGLRDLIVISVEGAVGMGVVVGGKLIEGENFAAGEIGHLTIDEHGGVCRCGRRGCLEVYITAAHAVSHDEDADAKQRKITLSAAGRALGILVAPIAIGLDLSKVIVVGPQDLVTDDFIDAAIETTNDRMLPVINTTVDVVPLAGDADLILLGAASRVLSKELGVM